ncbi:MAG: glycosyltransferase family 1 protein, partial [Desulfobacterales bacterium]|nr:glycosyltransferase family 1 protein [Desulfobacterales bacterium]
MYDLSTSSLFQKYYEIICNRFGNNKPLFSFLDYKQVLNEACIATNINIDENNIDKVAEHFWHVVGSRIYRHEPLEWLSQAGYNLALYGNGWEKHPTLAKHARGWINNGEELCKLFNASKINLCVHQIGNYSSRVFDGIASGGFFLMRYHPADYEEGGLGKYLDMENDIIIFHSRDDLLKKIDYYLKNPDKRKLFTAPVQNKIIRQYTYKNKMKEVLDIVSKRIASL